MKRVTAIIPCWNRQKDMDILLTSFIKIKDQCRILVIDDFSDVPLNVPDYAEVIRTNRRVGASTAKNIGLALCKTQFVWFLDSDTEIVGEDVLSVLDYFEDPKIGAVGAEIYEGKDGRLFCEHRFLPDCSGVRHQYEIKKRIWKEVSFIITCNMIMHTALAKFAGGFPDGLVCHEDAVLCLELKKMGYSLFLDSRLEVIHRLSPESRITEKERCEGSTAAVAFVFGASSSSVKRMFFWPCLIASRIIELSRIPRQLLTFRRFKNYKRSVDSDNSRSIWQRACEYKSKLLGYFRPAMINELRKGVKWRKTGFFSSRYLPYIEK